LLCAVNSCAVFHASELLTEGEPLKIPLHGNTLTKIFSYADRFVPALSRYVTGDSARPDPHVHLLCAQAVSVGKTDSSVLVRVKVSSQRAISDLIAADTAVSSA